MPIVEWNVPFTLTTPQDDIAFNTFSGGQPGYLLDRTACEAGADIRDTKDNVPQADGSILHRRFYTGYECKLTCSYWEDDENVACEDVAREMHDNLMRALRSLQEDSGRLVWTPSGAANRMFDEVRLLVRAAVSVQESSLIVVSFTLDTPFPYAQDETETTTSFTNASPTQHLDNTGSAPFYPVWKVHGPTSGFTISNVTTGEEIVYDADLPGASAIASGHYAEIDTFRNTVYLDGSSSNLKPGIEILNSDFFPLEVGDNEITIFGEGTFPAPDTDCLWQAAWA